MSGDRPLTPLVALWIALFSSAGAGVLSAWLYGVGGPLLMLVYLLPAVLTAAAQLGWSSATYPGNDERFHEQHGIGVVRRDVAAPGDRVRVRLGPRSGVEQR